MYFINVPPAISLLYPKIKKSFPDKKGKLFFTFDDGPDPEITPRILDILAETGAKATFFCTGEKAEKNQAITERARTEGHTIANHGYRHISGFRTNTAKYAENTAIGANITQSQLFRPPYGHITPFQYYRLSKSNTIVLWNILSNDFNNTLTSEKCHNIVQSRMKGGDIVVFHDTSGAFKDRLEMLRSLIRYAGSAHLELLAIKQSDI